MARSEGGLAVTIPKTRFAVVLSFVAAALLFSLLLSACAQTQDDVWHPTEEDPVYTDENGITWGIAYNPPDDGEDFVYISPDMEFSGGDNGAVGYMNREENEAAMAEIAEVFRGVPGESQAYVSVNLYAFLSDEVVGTSTFAAGYYEDYVKIQGSRNAWVPEYHLDTMTTDDGLVWGWRGDAGDVDMEFVRATDTGEWGYILDTDRYAAQEANFKSRDDGVEDPTVMIDVVLFGSDEVVGKYAVTLYTQPVG